MYPLAIKADNGKQDLDDFPTFPIYAIYVFRDFSIATFFLGGKKILREEWPLQGVLCACDGIQTRARVGTKILRPEFSSSCLS